MYNVRSRRYNRIVHWRVHGSLAWVTPYNLVTFCPPIVDFNTFLRDGPIYLLILRCVLEFSLQKQLELYTNCLFGNYHFFTFQEITLFVCQFSVILELRSSFYNYSEKTTPVGNFLFKRGTRFGFCYASSWPAMH